MARFSSGRRPHELWNGSCRCISTGRHLRRKNSQGSQGRRSTRPSVGESSVCYQSQDRKNARPYLPASVVWSRRRGDRMRRRAFILALGGAAAAPSLFRPLTARAQQAPMPVIGFLRPSTPESVVHLLAPFRAGLKEIGFIEGQNVAIEYRWAYGQEDRLGEIAAELVRRQVAVIVTPGSILAALAAKAQTKTIPIVFASGRGAGGSALVRARDQSIPDREQPRYRRGFHRHYASVDRRGARRPRCILYQPPCSTYDVDNSIGHSSNFSDTRVRRSWRAHVLRHELRGRMAQSRRLCRSRSQGREGSAGRADGQV